ncbi:TonB-dependent receptor [Alteromonas gilva]|uniref:TonB-dependent receptor n=1 Tax=Alteromonas gilva TaxID=2987522 RepID=A0ABT5L4X1_9ALTE|nr:TonB-dependent receptor [Alteromonas gilva]MDC8831913.1 TonB-dependent receptor [Alteromonas gilva]
MRQPLVRSVLLMALLTQYCGCTIAGEMAQAAVITPSPGDSLHLPAQSLDKALVAFARATNQTLVYDPTVVSHYEAPALTRPSSIRAGLQQLLSQSPLQVKAFANGWIITGVKQTTASVQPQKVASSASVMEEVTVTASYSDSLTKARQQKRFAPQSQEIVMATDIAEFPALNIADALNRTPGVSVERDRGEALFVSIRGLPTQFNTLSVNGLPIAANENVRTSEQYGRRFHYDILPAELVARVEVNKTSMASNFAGAMGGSVNISTYRPLTLGKQQFAFKAMSSESPLAGYRDPRVSVLGNWVNSSDSLGVMIAATYAERHVRQDRVLSFDWATEDGNSIGKQGDIYYTPNIRPTQEQEARYRFGLSAAVDWQRSPNQRLSLSYLGLGQSIDYDEYSYSADYDYTQLDSTVWDGNILTGGTTQAGAVQISRETAGLKDESQSVTVDHVWRTGGWEWQSQLGVSSATSYNDDPIKRTRLRRTGDVSLAFAYDRQHPSAIPSIDYGNIDLLAASDFPGRRLEWRENTINDSQHFANFHFTKALDWAGFTGLEAGLLIQRHERKYRRRDVIFTAGIEDQYFAPSAFFTNNGEFLDNLSHPLPRQWLVPHQAVFWSTIDEQALRRMAPTRSDLFNSYRVVENTNSTFVQLNFDYPSVWGNLGARLVNTAQSSHGYFVETSDASTLTPVSFTSDYYHFLPAANITVGVSPAWQLRGSISRALSRPDLPDLAPRLTLNSGDDLTAKGGNPYLQPIQAWQFDLGVERYTRGNGLIALSLFYKKLDSFIQYDLSQLTVNQKSYLLQGKSNGGNASVYGVELTYQDAFNPFLQARHQLGYNLNLTLTGSNATYQQDNQQWEDALEGVAKQTFNAEIYYETAQWAIRANYNWTSEILQQTALRNMPARYSAPFGALSLHASYKVSPQIMVFAEGMNLLDKAESDYVLNGYFTNYTYYGRTLSAGVRMMF